MSERLLDRKAFGALTFQRDRHLCVICGASAVDAHHILDRKLFADGGYYLSNGASLCAPCHLMAEKTLLGVEFIRDRCGIRDPVLPDGFDRSKHYDKWGNQIQDDGTRLQGPLFGDDGCKKILREAGLLHSGIFQLW